MRALEVDANLRRLLLARESLRPGGSGSTITSESVNGNGSVVLTATKNNYVTSDVRDGSSGFVNYQVQKRRKRVG
ncbi:hypothetical protein BCR33DRAFT_714974 [Rhizoclosmatium globosum]|uniref:Uncharacterized protein n=1 Tax=Rhizoclosmatium globosum TaxID=329046 RepID=A0A1Y2CJU3_9FUNG|nr:hypothetical protein BCR33DRAFT_714974 [Rhizoclosmatium globosum]|eukprot:ORY47207.1 hypothetical protein BCR33DRAFT_714974 [Rhizoclosmatium globosum]